MYFKFKGIRRHTCIVQLLLIEPIIHILLSHTDYSSTNALVALLLVPPVSQSKPRRPSTQISTCPKPSQSGLWDLYISTTKTRNGRRDFLVSANACMPLKHGKDDNGDTLRSLSWQQHHVTAVMWPLPSSSNMSKPAGGFDARGFCSVIVGFRHPKENSDIFLDGNEIPQVNKIK